jgi:hypothetical protein
MKSDIDLNNDKFLKIIRKKKESCSSLVVRSSTMELKIIVVVQVGAMKIYVDVVEELRKKERHYETQFITKIGGKN